MEVHQHKKAGLSFNEKKKWLELLKKSVYNE